MNPLLLEVATELRRAREKHPRPFNSSHEGYAILAEEVDELWDEVKAQTSERRYNAIRKEAIQIAAMCLRLVEDVCDRRSAGAEPLVAACFHPVGALSCLLPEGHKGPHRATGLRCACGHLHMADTNGEDAGCFDGQCGCTQWFGPAEAALLARRKP